MSLLDSYRRNAQRKREEIARLHNNKAREAEKIAKANSRALSASQTASRSKSASTIKSKMREIERCNKDIATAEKKIADVEKKIAAKQKQLVADQGKIEREEKKEAERRANEASRATRQQAEAMRDVSRTMNQHAERITKLEEIPQKITVLFLAASPVDLNPLRLDEEARAIKEMIRKSEHRDSVQFETCWASRPLDLLQAINEYKPTILHFSGHGASNGDLLFQGEYGETKLVSAPAIAQTVSASSDSIRLILFNACHSAIQAEQVVESVTSAIGMIEPIGDNAACIFASQFYSAIGFGHSVAKSFEQAKAALMLENIPQENVPQLFAQQGINLSELIIVDPNGNGTEKKEVGV
ncbi:CHAT domain-containing protein [Verrucomicrobiota bacterium]